MEEEKRGTSPIVSMSEAMKILKVSRHTLKTSKIPCCKLGKFVYYKVKDLENFTDFFEFKPMSEWED